MTAKSNGDYKNMYQHFMEKWGLDKRPLAPHYIPLENDEVECLGEDSIPNHQQPEQEDNLEAGGTGAAAAAAEASYSHDDKASAWRSWRKQQQQQQKEDETLRSQYWAYFRQAPQYGKLNDDALPTIDDLPPETCYCEEKKKEWKKATSSYQCLDNEAEEHSADTCRERHWAAHKRSYFEWWKQCRLARLYAAEERKARRQFVQDMSMAMDMAELKKIARERQRQEREFEEALRKAGPDRESDIYLQFL